MIHKKEMALMEKLYEALEKIPGIQVYGNSKECRGPVMSLNFKGLTASDAAYILESGYGITVRAGLHCSPLIHEAMGTQGISYSGRADRRLCGRTMNRGKVYEDYRKAAFKREMCRIRLVCNRLSYGCADRQRIYFKAEITWRFCIS